MTVKTMIGRTKERLTACWRGRDKIVVCGRDRRGVAVDGFIVRDDLMPCYYQVVWTKTYGDNCFDADDQDWGEKRNIKSLDEAMVALCELLDCDTIDVPELPSEWQSLLVKRIQTEVNSWSFCGTINERSQASESTATGGVVDGWAFSSLAYDTSEAWGLLNIDWEGVSEYWNILQNELKEATT